MVKKLLFTFLVIFFPITSWADFKFYLDVSPRAGSMDDTFVLSVVIEDLKENAKPYLIGGDDFEVQLLGPRHSTTIVNGDVSTEVAYNYQLTAKKEGVLESPSAEIEVGGQKYTAPAIKIKVEKGQNTAASASGDALILKQSLSSNKVYIGEQVQHMMSLYSAVPIYDYSFSDQVMDGFWSQGAGDVDKSQATLNDNRYNLFRWYKALYPLKTGTLTIPEREMSAKVQGPRRNRSFPFGRSDPFNDPFDSFFGAVETVQKNLRSNSLMLEAIPLPPKPAVYENWGLTNVLVGEAEIELHGSNDALSTGESKTLTLLVKSKGNLNAYNQLPIKETPNFRIYQDNPQEKNFLDGNELIMSKTFKISVIPLKPGMLKLPAFKLSYFDPKAGIYKTAESKALQFEVTGKDLTEGQAKQPESGIEEQKEEKIKEPEVKSEEPKIIYKEDSLLKKLSQEISLSLSLLILAIFTFFAYAVSLFRKVSGRKSYKRKIFNEIHSSKDANDLARIAARFLETSKDTENRFRLQTLLDKLDTIRYSKEKKGSENIQELKNELTGIVGQL